MCFCVCILCFNSTIVSSSSSSNIYANPVGGTKEFKTFKNTRHTDLRCIFASFPIPVYVYSLFASFVPEERIEATDAKILLAEFRRTAFPKWIFGKMQMRTCIMYIYILCRSLALSLSLFFR